MHTILKIFLVIILLPIILASDIVFGVIDNRIIVYLQDTIIMVKKLFTNC
jgi:hypothetical protein